MNTKLYTQRKKIILIIICAFISQLILIGLAGIKGNIVYDVLSILLITVIMIFIYLYQPEIFIKYLWFIIII